MEKNHSMMLEQRNRALGMLEAGMAVPHVVRNIGVTIVQFHVFGQHSTQQNH